MFFKREAIADTFALITFGLVVGMFVELFIAGLTLDQSLQSRLMEYSSESADCSPLRHLPRLGG